MPKRVRGQKSKSLSVFLDEAEVSGTDSSDHDYSSSCDSPGSLDEFIDDSHIPFQALDYRIDSSPDRGSDSADSSSLPISDSPVLPIPSSPVSVASQSAPVSVAEPATAEPSPSKPFRLQSKHIFLTYPQCDFLHTALLENLRARFPNPLNHFIVSREQHEDGQWHLHALLDLHEKLRTRSVSYFDNLVDPPKHPNIRSKLQSKPATVRYIVKGNNPDLIASTFDYQKFLHASASKRSTKATQICQLINEGRSIDEIDDLHPEYVLLHGRNLRDYVSFKSLKERRRQFAEAQQIAVRVLPAPDFSSVWNCRIVSWLSSNIRMPRVHRQRQLWISAPPSAGKTTMIMWMENEFKLSVYYWPKDEHWWDGYSDQAYDLIVLDEFRSQKKITELNPILSGDPTPLSRRSAAPLVKRDNLPVIILSNFTPEQCFHKCSEQQLAPLLDRLHVVALPDNQLLRFVREDDVPEPSIQPGDDEID